MRWAKVSMITVYAFDDEDLIPRLDVTSFKLALKFY